MLRSSLPCLLLAGACLTACSPATPDAAATPATQPAPAARAAVAAPCMPASEGAVTSKTRHIPDENDPCANSRGVAGR